MPTWGSSEPDYKRTARRRAEIKAALLAKGLVEGTNKFNEVMYRKLRRVR